MEDRDKFLVALNEKYNNKGEEEALGSKIEALSAIEIRDAIMRIQVNKIKFYQI